MRLATQMTTQKTTNTRNIRPSKSHNVLIPLNRISTAQPVPKTERHKLNRSRSFSTRSSISNTPTLLWSNDCDSKTYISILKSDILLLHRRMVELQNEMHGESVDSVQSLKELQIALSKQTYNGTGEESFAGVDSV